MKKVLMYTVILVVLFFSFSLSFADYANYAGPQLEFISNAIPMLWDKPKEEVLRTMTLFPAFICTDYTDQIGCKSKYNVDDANNSIYLNFFTDDYEDHHDNLWKVSITADVQTAEHFQSLLESCWLEGMRPMHSGTEEEFTYMSVQPLIFHTENTRLIAYFQRFDPKNNPFFLAEYYPVRG